MSEPSCKSEELTNLIQHSKKEIFFKLVVIGDFGVGKTSIIKRYSQGIYTNTYQITIGADFAIKTLEWDDHTRIIVQLWDIAGHERFGSLTSVYYRYAVGAAIVFDLTRPETFTSVDKWLTDLRDRVALPHNRSLPIILLANKGDVNLTSLPSEIAEFCRQRKITAWFITSAKDDTNIDNAMYHLIQAIMNNREAEQVHNSNNSIALNNTPKGASKRYRCCH